MEEAVTKEDWIILRLIKAGAKAYHYNPEYFRSVNYLIKKYGMKTLDGCISQLHAEGKPWQA